MKWIRWDAILRLKRILITQTFKYAAIFLKTNSSFWHTLNNFENNMFDTLIHNFLHSKSDT